MLKEIPDHWKHDKSMDMLWLFYQITDELLSETTSDTYALPLHNAITLLDEMDEVYSLLDQYGIVKEYYANYIPPIIEEFIVCTEDDSILKRMLGERLNSIRTGFQEASQNPILLNRWIGIFRQTCSPKKYRDTYKNEIEQLVLTNSPDKNNLIYCTKNYYISLLHAGYSREYLYTCAKRFFNNSKRPVLAPDQILPFLKQFNTSKKAYEFLILMNTESLDYIDGLSKDINIDIEIKKISTSEERKELCKDRLIADMFADYDKRLHQAKAHEKVEIVVFKDMALDPYIAANEFIEKMRFLQMFMVYFKHFYAANQVYKFLLKDENGSYHEFKLPNKLQKRPYIQQDLIDKRITNILGHKAMTPMALLSLAHAIEMHAESLESKNYRALVRTFWTALETLFLNPSANSGRENVINSVVAIIQKTYLLKITRLIYAQIRETLLSEDLEKLDITTYKYFLLFFASHEEGSEEMKALYSCLGDNILLRSRVYNLRKSLKSGEKISEFLSKHEIRINWQLKRLYRIRNIATHLGYEASGLSIAVNHLHSYFDYMVNYMLCKSENDDIIIDMSTLVLEAKNDNKIHHEQLKSKEPLSAANYMKYLFGPDSRLIDYKFEY